MVAAACTTSVQQPDLSSDPPPSIATSTPATPSTSLPARSTAPEAPEHVSYAGTLAAPEFPDGLDWLNTDRPLALAELRGKVVMLDFWTYGCINCIHIIPDLERLEQEYPNELVVIGVHSAKFDTERNTENIRQVVLRYGLEHPVVNDGDFAVWESYGARAWPTVFVIDPAGNVSGYHAGENVYEVVEPVIASLVAEFEDEGVLDRTPLDLRLESEGLPETVLSFPGKVTVDGDRLFIADTNHHRIVRATLSGDVQAVYGSGAEDYADGPAGAAAFDEPQGMAVGPTGDVLYVADTGNHSIRAIDLVSGEVTTAAGTGQQGTYPPTGGDAAATGLHSPWDLELNGDSLFVAMAGTHQIWEFDLTTDSIAPYVGSGAEGTENSTLATSTLAQPSSLSLDGGGRLYFADSESSSVRWADIAGSEGVHTLAGTDQGLFEFGDQDGVGTEALLQHPLGVVADGAVVWVADTYNSKLKKIDAQNGTVATFAGADAGWRDGPDPLFYEPGGIDLADGVLYVADTNNHSIRTVDTATGEAATIVFRGIEEFLPDADQDTYRGTILDLEPAVVAAGRGTLTLQVEIPDGYKVNPDAPSRFEWSADSPSVTFDPAGLGVQVNPAFPLQFTADFSSGAAAITGDLSIVYCDADTQAICLIEQVRVNLPVRVAAEGATRDITVTHRIVLPDL